MEDKEKLEYYKINEVLEHKYYQIPQELFVNPLYKDNLNSDSKLLYGFLLDRLTLSRKHNWYDENGNIYLIFTREEVQNKLNLSDKTVTKSFKQLTDVNLVREKRQGLGKPNLIFVGKIQHREINDVLDKENLRLQSRKNYDSRSVNIPFQESEILRGINTNIIKTNNINTDSINPHNEIENITLEEVKYKCKLNEFENEDKYILEDVIDRLYNCKFLKVGTVNIEKSKILSKLKLIKKDNLIQLINIRKESNNIINYLIMSLYNNLGNTKINSSENNKKSYSKDVGREDSNDFLETL